jgi:hypothetical protein
MKKYEAIHATHPNIVVIRGDVAYDKDENIVEYNESIVQSYIDAHSYKQFRAREYPPIGDQLDALWKGGDAATEMLAKVQAVKTKYPKGAT